MIRVPSGVYFLLTFAQLLVLSAFADDGYMMNSGVASKQVEASTQEWQPTNYKYSIGYEGTSSSYGPFSTNGASFGIWNHNFGIDFIFGVTKSSDSENTNETLSVPNILVTTGAETDTITNSGQSNPLSITFAARPKWKLFMNNWVQLYGGFLGGITKTFDNSYPTGTQVTSYPNQSDTSNASVTQTNYGSVSQSTSLQIFGGPVIGSEFYLKWIPHLALGFSTGLYMTTGGNTTTKTSYGSQTYAISGGVAQAPTSGSSTTNTSTTSIGKSANTYGAGGALFSLFSSYFTIRYVW